MSWSGLALDKIGIPKGVVFEICKENNILIRQFGEIPAVAVEDVEKIRAIYLERERQRERQRVRQRNIEREAELFGGGEESWARQNAGARGTQNVPTCRSCGTTISANGRCRCS